MLIYNSFFDQVVYQQRKIRSENQEKTTLIIKKPDAKDASERYNLIHVYPGQQPYVRYDSVENGIPPPPATHFSPATVGSRGYRNIPPINIPPRTSSYKLHNGPTQFIVQQSNQVVQPSSFRITEATIKYRNRVHNSQSLNRNSQSSAMTQTNSTQTVPSICDIEIKREKEDSPVEIRNDILSPLQKCTGERFSVGERRNNIKSVKANNLQSELTGRNKYIDNPNQDTATASLLTEKSCSDSPRIMLDDERRIGRSSIFRESSSIMMEPDKRQPEHSLVFQDSSSSTSGDERNKLATYRHSVGRLSEGETKNDLAHYRDSTSTSLVDDKLESDSLEYRNLSPVPMENGRRQLKNISADYPELPTLLMDDDRRQTEEKSTPYQDSPISSDGEKRQLNDTLDYGELPSMLMDEDRHQVQDNSSACRASPVSSEGDKLRWGNTSATYIESSSNLTDEERRRIDDDLEMYSNSSSIYDQAKDSGSDHMIELRTEGERLSNEYVMKENHEDKTDPNNLMVSVRENYERSYYNFANSYADGTSPQKYEPKRSIDYVTNRLAVRERAKIFRRSEKKWHVAVNETAYQLALKDPKLLQNKKELRMVAEAEVRKTYRFAKGKSRSIAIPENRILAEERKKQKLTKDKINEIKRQLNSEGEELSRQMRQCHMNLTLATQQSDVTKNMQLREKMQLLNQQQAKLHFKMDELLSKERKLNLVKTSASILDQKTVFEPQSTGSYAYLPGTVISPVSVVSSTSQVHVNDSVHIVQISSQESMPYVNYDANINVIN